MADDPYPQTEIYTVFSFQPFVKGRQHYPSIHLEAKNLKTDEETFVQYTYVEKYDIVYVSDDPSAIGTPVGVPSSRGHPVVILFNDAEKHRIYNKLKLIESVVHIGKFSDFDLKTFKNIVKYNKRWQMPDTVFY